MRSVSAPRPSATSLIALVIVGAVYVAGVFAHPIGVEPPFADRNYRVAVAPDFLREDPDADNFTSVEHPQLQACVAGSKIKRGIFSSRHPNLPRPILNSSCGDGLILIAQPGVVTELKEGKGRGMRAAFINRSAATLVFQTCMSRLPISQQAQAADGTWRTIEHRADSWCGNSYSTVVIEPGEFWSFAVPRYRGSIPTRLRFTMYLESGEAIHSNEFAGSINPGQMPHYDEPVIDAH